jgi:hypothetical protein
MGKIDVLPSIQLHYIEAETDGVTCIVLHQAHNLVLKTSSQFLIPRPHRGIQTSFFINTNSPFIQEFTYSVTSYTERKEQYSGKQAVRCVRGVEIVEILH